MPVTYRTGFGSLDRCPEGDIHGALLRIRRNFDRMRDTKFTITPTRNVTAATEASINDYTLIATSGTFTISLPTAVGILGRQYVVKNSGSGVITVDAYSTQTIDGALTKTVASGAAIYVQSDGANWIQILPATLLSRSVSSVSAPTTLGSTPNTDYVYYVSGTTTVTLPTAVGNTNRYTVKNVGSGTVTIATTSSQTIDGSSSASLPVQYTSLDLVSDGANWNVV